MWQTYLELFATANLDYTVISELMFILNGSMMTVQIPVPIVDDDIFESDETFIGLLSVISGERVTVDIDMANATIIASMNEYT